MKRRGVRIAIRPNPQPELDSIRPNPLIPPSPTAATGTEPGPSACTVMNSLSVNPTILWALTSVHK